MHPLFSGVSNWNYFAMLAVTIVLAERLRLERRHVIEDGDERTGEWSIQQNFQRVDSHALSLLIIHLFPLTWYVIISALKRI